MILSKARHAFLIIALITSFQVVTARPAEATCCACSVCPMVLGLHIFTQTSLIMDINSKIQSFFMGNILGELTGVYIRSALETWMLELSTASFSIIAPIGAMIDGQVHNTAITELQTLQTKAIKDQMPSVPMCQFASLTKTVADNEKRKNLTQNVLSKHTLDRRLGARGLAGSSGTQSRLRDMETRFTTFLSTYCDPNDEYGNLQRVYPAECAGPDDRINRDIDYTGLIHSMLTLNINHEDQTSTPDEQDVFAMSTNLYASNIVERPEDRVLFNPENYDNYLALKSLMAKQSVAENSFNALVAMKSINPATNTSYYEDMQKLTKGNYQDPAFFASLYDNPTNVLRQNAAMQGIGLMQQRDIYESQIRSEMLLSILLETRLEGEAKELEGNLR